MAISFVPLGSGSKGNSILVIGSNGDKFLIDCGFCPATLSERLATTGTTLEEIKGVVITHEHSDHVKGISMLSDKWGIPVIGQERTLKYIKKKLASECCIDAKCVLKTALTFADTDAFILGGMKVIPFKTPHDAVCSVGYRFEEENSVAVYATDMGYVSKDVKAMLKGADLVLLESNYDRNLLINGKYPPSLKARILSTHGHLSNDDCAFTVADLLKEGTKNFILGHISEENNNPELVKTRTVSELEKTGAIIDKDYKLQIALQNEAGVRMYAEK